MTMFHWEEGPSSSWTLVEGGLLTLGCVRERPANGGLDKGRALGLDEAKDCCALISQYFLVVSGASLCPVISGSA